MFILIVIYIFGVVKWILNSSTTDAHEIVIIFHTFIIFFNVYLKRCRLNLQAHTC